MRGRWLCSLQELSGVWKARASAIGSGAGALAGVVVFDDGDDVDFFEGVDDLYLERGDAGPARRVDELRLAEDLVGVVGPLRTATGMVEMDPDRAASSRRMGIRGL